MSNINSVIELKQMAEKTLGHAYSGISIKGDDLTLHYVFSIKVMTARQDAILEAVLNPQPVPESVRDNYTHSDTKRNAIIKERWTEDTDKERAENKGVLRRFWVGEWDEAMAKELSLSKFAVTSRRQKLGCVVCQRPKRKQRNLKLTGGSHGKKKV